MRQSASSPREPGRRLSTRAAGRRSPEAKAVLPPSWPGDVRTIGNGTLCFAVLDRHPLMRAGLAAAIGASYGGSVETIEVKGSAELREAAEHDANISAVLCDLDSLGDDRFQALAEIVEAFGPHPVLALVEEGTYEEARRAMEIGAVAYVRKSGPAALLRAILQLALTGERYLPADLLMTAIGTPRTQVSDEPSPASPPLPSFRLSHRQHEILRLVADGYPNKAIAERLGIRVGTVKVQLRTIFRAIGVSNRTQAALLARGLDHLDSAAA